jgi:hypothetical protein
MSDDTNIAEFPRKVSFTIDGQLFSTPDRRQPAADLLRLAGLDPARYDLGELRGHRPEPIRYSDTDIVEIHEGARFVSIRQKADVA